MPKFCFTEDKIASAVSGYIPSALALKSFHVPFLFIYLTFTQFLRSEQTKAPIFCSFLLAEADLAYMATKVLLAFNPGSRLPELNFTVELPGMQTRPEVTTPG